MEREANLSHRYHFPPPRWRGRLTSIKGAGHLVQDPTQSSELRDGLAHRQELLLRQWRQVIEMRPHEHGRVGGLRHAPCRCALPQELPIAGVEAHV